MDKQKIFNIVLGTFVTCLTYDAFVHNDVLKKHDRYIKFLDSQREKIWEDIENLQKQKKNE
jgi:hypothetical protein